MIAYDKSNVGSVIGELIEDSGVKTMALDCHNAQLRNSMVQGLSLAFEQQQISLPDPSTEWADDEAQTLLDELDFCFRFTQVASNRRHHPVQFTCQAQRSAHCLSCAHHGLARLHPCNKRAEACRAGVEFPGRDAGVVDVRADILDFKISPGRPAHFLAGVGWSLFPAPMILI